MIEHKPIFQPASPLVQQFDRPLRTIAELDRVVLADVKKEWNDYQSVRDRSAIYGYLHMVFMQVDWWTQKPDEMREALQTIKIGTPNIKLPDDMYAAVIMLTADPKKVDDKTRSKWSRSLAVRRRIQARERAAHGLSSAQGCHQQVRGEVYASPRAKQQNESHEISIDRIVSVIQNFDQRCTKSKAVKSNGTLIYESFKSRHGAQRSCDNELRISKCNLVKYLEAAAQLSHVDLQHPQHRRKRDRVSCQLGQLTPAPCKLIRALGVACIRRMRATKADRNTTNGETKMTNEVT